MISGVVGTLGSLGSVNRLFPGLGLAKISRSMPRPSVVADASFLGAEVVLPMKNPDVFPKRLLGTNRSERPPIQVSQTLIDAAAMTAAGVYERMATRPEGLTDDEAEKRLDEYGPNVLAKDHRTGIGSLLWHAVINPLVVLLAVLATVSFATGDPAPGR